MKNALILCLGLMAGCKSESVDSLTLGSDFPLTTKQPVQVGDVQLALAGVEDSRCPKNVQCVRAGEVVVDLALNAQQNVKMCLGDCQVVGRKTSVTQDSLEVTVNQQKYLLILKQVTPESRTEKVPNEQYQLQMQVLKK